MIRTNRRGGPRWAPSVALGLVCVLLVSCSPADDVEALFYDLEHPDYEVRLDAQEKLAEIMRQGRHESFLRALESDNLLVRANAIVFLGQMPQPGARHALRSLLALDRRMMLPYNPIQMEPSSESFDSRILVANLFSRTEADPDAIVALLDGATPEQEPEVVQGTCLAIGALGDPRGVSFLSEASGHADLDVVRAAIEALGHVRSEQALAALEKRSTHPKMLVRSDVLTALALYPRAEVGDLMRTMGATDDSHEIRQAAVEMLSQPGDSSMVPYLIDRLQDEHEAVRAAARAGLQRLTNQALGTDAEAWLEWWAANEASFAAAR